MPAPLAVPIALGIGSMLSGLFGNLFGAKVQSNAVLDTTKLQIDANARAAELEKAALDDALNYQKEIDARDYKDWLAREARDRTDWEAAELRKAPGRALADSSIRTLADYIRVPGMQPAQEVPVQRWRAQPPQMGTQGQPGAPTSSTMPVGGSLAVYADPMLQPPQTRQPQPDPSLLARFGRHPRTLRDLTYA